jgi:aryl-alcohol dehydrogenase-like predicted oxidoreductase
MKKELHTDGGKGAFAKTGSTDIEGARRQIDLCLDAGINLFDTADVYSAGLSEEILGRALKSRPDKALVASKVRFRTGDGPNDAGLSRFHLIEACEASLNRLGTDHISFSCTSGTARRRSKKPLRRSTASSVSARCATSACPTSPVGT